MTIDEIKTAICRYFNALGGVQLIKSPTNAPAPIGLYIAVGIDSVEQYGHRMETSMTGNGQATNEQVATVALTEIEGDGDELRLIKNAIQGPEFREYAAAAGFTIWDVGNIAKIDTYDGAFYVRQWRLTFRANFEDREPIKKGRIESVNPLDLNAEF